MSANAEKILQEALNLPPQDRAEVLERLLATFQEAPDPELDKLWALEAEDRLDAYERGELDSVSADEVRQNRSSAREMKIIYLDAADAEFQEAIDYYNEQRAELRFRVF